MEFGSICRFFVGSLVPAIFFGLLFFYCVREALCALMLHNCYTNKSMIICYYFEIIKYYSCAITFHISFYTCIMTLNVMTLTMQYHAETIKNVREAAESFGAGTVDYRPVAIALDTKGPEIRTGLVKGVSTEELQITP